MTNRTRWQHEHERLVAQVIRDAGTLARCGYDQSHPDWWPAINRIAGARPRLNTLALIVDGATPNPDPRQPNTQEVT
jgi:hypothetical protein